MPSEVDNVWEPGALDKTFAAITTDPYFKQQYDINVI